MKSLSLAACFALAGFSAQAALIEIDVSTLTFENDTAEPAPILPYGLSGDTSFLFDTVSLSLSEVAFLSPGGAYSSGTWDDGDGGFDMAGPADRVMSIDTFWTLAELEALAVGASDVRFPVGDERSPDFSYFAFISDGGVTATRLADPVPPIPLPAGFLLSLTALAGLALLRRSG